MVRKESPLGGIASNSSSLGLGVPFSHFPLSWVPFPDDTFSNVVLIVVLGRIFFHTLPECNIDPATLAPFTFPFRDAVQPIGLSPSSHKHHIPASQG